MAREGWQCWASIMVLALAVAASAWVPGIVAQQFGSTFPKVFATETPTTFQNFDSEFSVYWGPENVQTTDSGQMLDLLLTNASGAGFGSKRAYLFGRINMNLKLISGDSSGTVTTYYLSSSGDKHDELDFEFLGNQSGQPYLLQTNVFASGVGDREQRIFLWFDPSADFHSYSVLWTRNLIIFEVDGVPIRIFRNNEAMGLPYLNAQPMNVYSSLWNGETWATEGGRIKVNWTYAPFVATFQNYNYDACEWTGDGTPPCAEISSVNWWEAAEYQTLSDSQYNELIKVQETYMVYDYCTDNTRWNTTPPECATNL
ncbi:unnamed protein product [Calypogeia fissa]